MGKLKNEIISCIKCGNANFVKVRDFEAGYFKCSRCGEVNVTSIHIYSELLLESLPAFGFLVSAGDPSERYALKPGPNVVGVGEVADVVLKRVQHEGKYFISRKHCTITVLFDKRNGVLHYLLEDGAAGSENGVPKPSLNYTFHKGKKLEQQEAVYVADQELINLGGKDLFRLEHYHIAEEVLAKFKTAQKIEDGGTT